jgi:Holliday junction resolvase RusA-like endonuclease
MLKLNIKPLSVNEAYQGRRFRTPKHDAFKTEIKYLLPDWFKMPEAPYFLQIEFGFSSSASDIDNCIKTFADSLQDKYCFNDKLIKRLLIDVEQVPKGKEYIKFKIEHLTK